MKAVVTVTGKDSMGIIAKVSALCTEYDRLHHERISRSGLKHRFDKILSLAENLEDPAGEEG